ncbi:MAG TPA: hypothetical protein VIS04_05715 [Woeseiaceae bacterium]
MGETFIRYRDGYKYQLVSAYEVQIGAAPAQNIISDYIDLSTDGVLTMKKGYAWDGPSGPTIDSRNFMRGSLVHDALYQLIRHEYLTLDWKELADRELQRLCREDGMSALRAWWVYRGVKWFGKPAVMPEAKKPILTAPRQDGDGS